MQSKKKLALSIDIHVKEFLAIGICLKINNVLVYLVSLKFIKKPVTNTKQKFEN